MTDLIKVAAVSFRLEIRNMLQRHIGGILKDVANVTSVTPEEALASRYDLYVVYTHGLVFKQLSRKINVEQLIPVELYPLPVGMKKVLALPDAIRLGVVAGHLWDAADFLQQLICMGARNYVFLTGTPDTVSSMEVDKYVVPEEIAPYIKDPQAVKKMVIVPRTLDSHSVGKIINTAMRLQKGLREKSQRSTDC